MVDTSIRSQGSGYAKLRVNDVKSTDIALKMDGNESKRSDAGRNMAKSRYAALRSSKGGSRWTALKAGDSKSK